MIHSNLLFECKSIKYLTSNIIAVTGNSSLGHLEILQVNDENENSNKQEFASSGSFRNLSELEFPSSVLTNMEICGIANQARTLIATSNIDFKTKQGYICLTNAQLSSDSCPLEVASTLVSNDPISKFTSLSFHLHQTHLAAASSIGDVSVFDILSEQQVCFSHTI